MINDDLYSEIKSKNFLKRGYSLNKIKMSLSLKGIDSELLKKTIESIIELMKTQIFILQLKYAKEEELTRTDLMQIKKCFLKKILVCWHELDFQ